MERRNMFLRYDGLLLGIALGVVLTHFVYAYRERGSGKEDDVEEVKSWKTQIKKLWGKPHGIEKRNLLLNVTFNPFDSQLTEERVLAHDGCFLLNKYIFSKDAAIRKDILLTLIGEYDKEAPPFIESPFYCDYGYNLKLGKGVYMNFGCTILDCAPVEIGDYTMFGPGCKISAVVHPLNAEERTTFPYPELALPVKIGKKCWLATGVQVLPGVTIGDNVVVGAGSVVARDLPSNCLAIGVPAKVIRPL